METSGVSGTTTINGDLKKDGGKISPKRNHSSSSVTSSPDSPLDDSFLDSLYELGKSVSSTASSPDHAKVIRLCPESEHPAPPIPGPGKTPGKMPVSESPPTQQMMERCPNEPYRIPAYVFAPSQSTNQMDWSIASNESLFSIHMGNNSTRDPLWNSGEIITPSAEMCNFSVHQSPVHDYPGETTGNGELMSEEEEEIMREVRRLNEEEQDHGKSISEGRMSRISEESGTSTRSFAFPILTGDADQGPLMKMASAARMGNSPRLLNSKPQTKPKPKPEQEPKPKEKPKPKPKPKSDDSAAEKSSWYKCFSCFSCFSCRSPCS